MNLLFICPHGAAKSIIAAAVAQDVAESRGLDVKCSNAGTDPDPQNNPVAVAALESHGLVWVDAPRAVTTSDIARADVVVTLGAPVEELPQMPTQLVDWSDVPDASADVEALYDILTSRITHLVDGLTETEDLPT